MKVGKKKIVCEGVEEVIWNGEELDWVKTDTREYLRGVGVKYLLNRYFEEGWLKILEKYAPQKRYRLGLIIPCSYGKPYSQSFIHYKIREIIKDFIRNGDIHEIIVTNAGVIPRELDEYWPFCAYDWNPKYENEAIRECYTQVLAYRLEHYLRVHGGSYVSLASYLRWDSDSWKAVNLVSERINREIPNLAPVSVPRDEVEEASLNGLYEDPDLVLITPTALRNLRKGIESLLR